MSERIHIEPPPELQALLPRYLENRRRDLKNLHEALSRGDLAFIQVTSHKIKGHAASYGFPDLSEICGRLEKMILRRQPDAEDILASNVLGLLKEYENYLERVDIG